MIKFLSWLHGWVGAVIGLLFGFLFFTGAVLMVETMIIQHDTASVMPSRDAEMTAEEISSELDLVLARGEQLGLNVASIRVPLKEIPAYRVSEPRGGETVYMIPGELDVVHPGHSAILEAPAVHAVIEAFTDWHVSLIDNSRWGGVVAIIGSILGLVGIIIFWPWRRTFNWRNWSWPTKWNRATLMSNHLTAGMVSLVFLLFFGVTGAFLEYRREVSDWLGPYEEAAAGNMDLRLQQINRELGPPSVAISTQQQAEPVVVAPVRVNNQLAATEPYETSPAAPAVAAQPTRLTLQELSQRAMQVAEGRIPSDISGFTGNTVSFRMRYPDNPIQPLGRTYVRMDTRTGEVLSIEMEEDRLFLRKVAHLSGPLHMGGEVPLLYQALSVFGSILVSIICFTGFVSFVRKKLVASAA